VIRSWIQRTWGRLRGQPGEQERLVAALIDGESEDRAVLAGLLELLPEGAAVEGGTREVLLVGLRRRMEHADDETLAAHFDFWEQLTARFATDAELTWTHGYMRYLAERDEEALRLFLAAYDLAPELIVRDEERGDLLDEAALASDQPPGLRIWWELALLRGLLAAEREEARELYSELLDEWGDSPGVEPAATARLRELGGRLAALEDEGRLPRAIVRRTRPRPPLP
jgi:hypothetical protein